MSAAAPGFFSKSVRVLLQIATKPFLRFFYNEYSLGIVYRYMSSLLLSSCNLFERRKKFSPCEIRFAFFVLLLCGGAGHFKGWLRLRSMAINSASSPGPSL